MPRVWGIFSQSIWASLSFFKYPSGPISEYSKLISRRALVTRLSKNETWLSSSKLYGKEFKCTLSHPANLKNPLGSEYSLHCVFSFMLTSLIDLSDKEDSSPWEEMWAWDDWGCEDRGMFDGSTCEDSGSEGGYCAIVGTSSCEGSGAGWETEDCDEIGCEESAVSSAIESRENQHLYPAITAHIDLLLVALRGGLDSWGLALVGLFFPLMV